jgi:diketogulonate reductase-like aldo/keto reductase
VESKSLGNTNVQIPEIGLGTSRYHGGVEPLRRGVALGAFIDTAEMYRTEGIVGEALEAVRDRVFIASKVLHDNLRYADLMQAAERSLNLLRTDCMDLYQLHYPNSRIPIEETMGAMEELVDRGRVGYIGVSNFSVGDLEGPLAVMRKYPIVSNQVRYSLTHRNIERDLLPFCQAHQITVIAHTPLDQGGLASQPRLRCREATSVLSEIAADQGKTLAQVALNWCLSRPNVVAIPKSSRVEGVIEDCEASGWSLEPEQVAALDQAFS